MNILLLFGGESSEHEVSLVSGRNVYDALDKTQYDVTLCYISRDGKWQLVDSFDDLETLRGLTPVLGEKKFTVSDDSTVEVDVLLPVLHGLHGEDGDVQGLARLLHVPYVGPSLIGAAVTMDKDVTKRLLRDANVPVVDWIMWNVNDPAPTYGFASSQLSETLFIKPANAGSSVGVSKAVDETSFAAALELASKHDNFVLIEKAVKAREIELAVIGNEIPEVTMPGEIIPGEEFYSYEDKYAEGSSSQAVIPAPLNNELVEQLQAYAIQAYTATRGQGMARIDFFVTDKNEIFLNEINSIPGFTNISMYPKLWQHEGLTYPQLLDRLISLALEV